jgi:hypothetical protein
MFIHNFNGCQDDNGDELRVGLGFCSEFSALAYLHAYHIPRQINYEIETIFALSNFMCFFGSKIVCMIRRPHYAGMHLAQ